MAYALVIFDLDGTLVDSLPWFLRHVNDVADRYGFRRVREDEIETLRRAGSREVLAHMKVPLWKLPVIARHMRRLKARHAGDLPLFAGVVPMLEAVRESGLRLALVSSDDEANVRRQLGDTAAGLFSDFVCSAAMFGKAAKFRRVLKRAGVDPAAVISIGDEVRDIEAARAAGIACGVVTWGYAAPEALRGRKPDLVFECMEDIPRLLAPAARG